MLLLPVQCVRISSLDPLLVTKIPKYLNLWTVSSACPLTVMLFVVHSVLMMDMIWFSLHLSPYHEHLRNCLSVSPRFSALLVN